MTRKMNAFSNNHGIWFLLKFEISDSMYFSSLKEISCCCFLKRM